MGDAPPEEAPPQERAQLRELIETSLRQQGFNVQDGKIILPATVSKDQLRCLHRWSVQHRIEDGMRVA